MSTPLTGTLVRDIQTFTGGSPVNQSFGICADPSDTYCYIADPSTANRVMQCKISDGTFSAFVTGLTTPYAVAVSADGNTLYILQDNGDIYSALISSPTPVLIGSLNNVNGGTSTWRILLLDPSNPNRLIVGNVSLKELYYFDIGAATFGYLTYVATSMFINAVGVWNADPTNYLLLTTSTSGNGLGGQSVLLWSRRQDSMEIIAGNGGTSDAVGTAATSGISTNSGKHKISSDTDGRVYFQRSTGFPMKVENGQTSILVSTNYGIGGTWFCPTINRLLCCGGNAHVYVLS